MYAIRGVRVGQGFRVQAVVFHAAAWILLESITAEHEHAARHGAIVILEDVDGPEDVRLAPYPVTIEGEDHPTVRSQEELVAEFRAEMAVRDHELANLHTQLLALEGENHRAYEEIAELRARVGGVEVTVQGVATDVANFPAEAFAPAGMVADLPSSHVDGSGGAGHNGPADLHAGSEEQAAA